MTHISPPGGEPFVQRQEPNQYHTPCYVVFQIDESRSERQHFSDLQMAYLWSKEMMNLYVAEGERWVMKSWRNTIRSLYEFHMEDRSGYEVATGPHKAVIIYYDI